MNTYKNYIDLLRNILKNFDNNEFDDIINKGWSHKAPFSRLYLVKL